MRRRLRLAAGLLMAICAGQPASALAASDVLIDGFDHDGFAQGGGLYYKKNFEQSAGSLAFQSKVTHEGTGALKLSVRPICPKDQDSCSERAEIWEKPTLRVPYDQGVWYGFAVKFAEPIPADDHRYLIAQWKREIDDGAEGDFSPFFALRLRNGQLFATVETNYIAPQGKAKPGADGVCPDRGTRVWLRPDSNQMRALVAADSAWTVDDGSLFQDCTAAIEVIDRGNPLPGPSSGWIDFVVYTRPGPDGSGRIELFANSKPVVTVTGHIGHADKGLGKNQYFKFGPYRAGHDGEWTLYYDDFRRSRRCEDVLKGGGCPPL